MSRNSWAYPTIFLFIPLAGPIPPLPPILLCLSGYNGNFEDDPRVRFVLGVRTPSVEKHEAEIPCKKIYLYSLRIVEFGLVMLRRCNNVGVYRISQFLQVYASPLSFGIRPRGTRYLSFYGPKVGDFSVLGRDVLIAYCNELHILHLIAVLGARATAYEVLNLHCAPFLLL